MQDIPAPDHQLKVPVVRRDAYEVALEQATPRHAFVHCAVRGRWTREVKGQLSADFASLRALHGGPLYALHFPGDAKHLKFLRMFGFVRVAQFIDASGVPAEIHQID